MEEKQIMDNHAISAINEETLRIALEETTRQLQLLHEYVRDLSCNVVDTNINLQDTFNDNQETVRFSNASEVPLYRLIETEIEYTTFSIVLCDNSQYPARYRPLTHYSIENVNGTVTLKFDSNYTGTVTMTTHSQGYNPPSPTPIRSLGHDFNVPSFTLMKHNKMEIIEDESLSGVVDHIQKGNNNNV